MGSEVANKDGELSSSGPQPESPVSDDPEDESSGPTLLPIDMVFDLLKNQRRRRLLQYLKEHEEPVQLGEVAEHIAALENGKSVKAISASERKCVYVSLYQCHLPKMDDMDVVKFNKNRGRIELAGNAKELYPYLQEIADTSRPWHYYYASIAVGGFGLAAVALIVPSLTTGILVTVLLAFLACAAAHTYALR